jgi:hypothetical protein
VSLPDCEGGGSCQRGLGPSPRGAAGDQDRATLEGEPLATPAEYADSCSGERPRQYPGSLINRDTEHRETEQRSTEYDSRSSGLDSSRWPAFRGASPVESGPAVHGGGCAVSVSLKNARQAVCQVHPGATHGISEMSGARCRLDDARLAALHGGALGPRNCLPLVRAGGQPSSL